MSHVVQELEAKFLTINGRQPEDVLRRLQESLTWAGFRVQPKGRRAFTDRYFDTVDHQLRGAGWSYREREDEQGRRIALKEVTRARAAIFDREEVEQPLDRDEDIRRPRSGPVSDRLSNLLHPDAHISPLFMVESQRAAYSLSHPDHPRGLVEMALDEARIAAKDTVAFKEVAIELKTGPHELLASILAAVELEPALMDARLSKFERGLMAAGCPLERRRLPQARRLDRQARWVDLAIGQLKAQLHQIRLYEPHAWEGVHVEGVHQMRVATRRARAALRAFAGVLPRAEANRLAPRLRWLAGALGEVRDLDVHLQHLEVYRQRLESFERHTLDQYARHLHELHQSAHRNLVKALSDQEYPALLADFKALLTATARPEHAAPVRVHQVAGSTVVPLLKRVLQRGRSLSDRSPDKHLHRLRIDVKRLRYQLEFLEDCYAGELNPVLESLRALQSRLGLHQDACVARAHLDRYRKVHAAGRWERALFKELVRLEDKRARKHRRKYPREWHSFETAAATLPAALEAASPM